MTDLQLALLLRLLVPRERNGQHVYDMRAQIVLLICSHHEVCSTTEISRATGSGIATACEWRGIAEKAGLIESWRSGRNTHSRVTARGKRVLMALRKGSAE